MTLKSGISAVADGIYMGYGKHHGFKFLSVVGTDFNAGICAFYNSLCTGPNGMILELDGPRTGSRNDRWIWSSTNLEEAIAQLGMVQSCCIALF